MAAWQPKASLSGTCGVAVDRSGNLVIADSGDFQIQVVPASTATFYQKAMTAGDVYTVAGAGGANGLGNGGQATHATLWGPYGVAVNNAGGPSIADTFNQRIREVTG
jgi:DNA-binding beta-propeller fold protein YncE